LGSISRLENTYSISKPFRRCDHSTVYHHSVGERRHQSSNVKMPQLHGYYVETTQLTELVQIRHSCCVLPCSCRYSNCFIVKKHDFHKLFMHQTWLGDEGRYLLAFRIHNSKLTKTVVTTIWLWTADMMTTSP
jgi:hypothetical protein